MDYIYEPEPATILDTRPAAPRRDPGVPGAAGVGGGRARRAHDGDGRGHKNATDVIEQLTLYMNKMRQASITREIIEVVSGAQAL